MNPLGVAFEAPIWPAVFAAVWAIALSLFFLAPGGTAEKSLAVLHGLCAQQPDHSFRFGDQRLPFDARMTGIYGGFVTASLSLIAGRRLRRGGLPKLSVVVALASFVVALGVDGVNSTLRDLGVWYAYEPRNELRLATGLLTGIALAVFIWFLNCQVAFARRVRQADAPVEGLRDLGKIVAVAAAMGGVVLVGAEAMYVPIALALIVSAVCALGGLMLAFVLLVGRLENRATSMKQLFGPATIATVLAMTLMGALSVARYALEAWLNIGLTAGGAG